MKIFKNYLILSLLFVALSVFIACDDEDNDEPTPATTTTNTGGGNNGGGTTAITLNDVSFRKGKVNVSGTETATMESFLIQANSGGSKYDFYRLSVNDNQKTAQVWIYMPSRLNLDTPPNGTYNVASPLDSLDQIFVFPQYVGSETFEGTANTTGSVIVSNSDSATFSIDIVFDFKDLENSNGQKVNLQGAMNN